MLVNLSPKNNFISSRRQHEKNLNRFLRDTGEAKWKKETFKSMYKRTGYTGIYIAYLSEQNISTWCKQKCVAVHDYGVCDSPKQVFDYFNTKNYKGSCVILMMPVKREHQPKYFGWKWDMWGTYIGTQNPQHEYLYDELNINLIYTFCIYKVV